VNEYAFTATLTGPDQGREVVRSQLLPYIGRLIEAGKRVSVTAMEEEDSKSIRQRRYYHGVVLAEIAQQATINGQKFDMPVWKSYMRERFVGYRWEVSKNPMTGKKQRRKLRISSEDLSVKAYSRLIDEVSAFAATELNVIFSVPNWESYRG